MAGQNFGKRLRRWVRSRLHYLGFLLLCGLLLSGCVRYDVGVTFQGQFAGSITQEIELGEQLTSFSQGEVKTWLKTLEQRAKSLQGKVERVSDRQLKLIIPFSNGAELNRKFNQFFNPTEQTPEQRAMAEGEEIVELSASLGLTQSNLLLLERDRLRLEVDLRSLGGLSGDGYANANRQQLLNTNSLLNLEFSLATPWGARAVDPQIPVERSGDLLVWQLQPGQLNYIEAVFWLPSSLGLGTVAIIALVVVGIGLKNRFRPDPE